MRKSTCTTARSLGFRFSHSIESRSWYVQRLFPEVNATSRELQHTQKFIRTLVSLSWNTGSDSMSEKKSVFWAVGGFQPPTAHFL